MYTFILVIHVISSLVLIAVILLQAGRGGGLAEVFGGGGGMSQLFGTKTATVLGRATAVCAVTFLSASLLLAVLSSRKNISLMEMGAQQAVPLAQELPPLEIPEEAAEVEEVAEEAPAPSPEPAPVEATNPDGE